MSDQDSHERLYTFFHQDGPLTLSEHELCNGFMRMREALLGNGHRPPGTPSFHLDDCSGCLALVLGDTSNQDTKDEA